MVIVCNPAHYACTQLAKCPVGCIIRYGKVLPQRSRCYSNDEVILQQPAGRQTQETKQAARTNGVVVERRQLCVRHTLADTKITSLPTYPTVLCFTAMQSYNFTANLLCWLLTLLHLRPPAPTLREILQWLRTPSPGDQALTVGRVVPGSLCDG